MNLSVASSPTYSLVSYCYSASQLGGDWFATYELAENKLLILLADVVNQSPLALEIAKHAKQAADTYMEGVAKHQNQVLDKLPSMLLAALNETLISTGKHTYFMTMAAVLVDFTKLTILLASAEHPMVALITPVEQGNDVKYIGSVHGAKLGIDSKNEYVTESFPFLAHEIIFLYTNGILEAENDCGKEYGIKKFRQSLERNKFISQEKYLEDIVKDAFLFYQGIPPKDDIALICLKGTA